jgi:uroporphyrinogen-III synthase
MQIGCFSVVKMVLNISIRSEISNLKSETKIAAINQGTAQALFELGFKVDFIGSGNDLQKIATDFDDYSIR